MLEVGKLRREITISSMPMIKSSRQRFSTKLKHKQLLIKKSLSLTILYIENLIICVINLIAIYSKKQSLSFVCYSEKFCFVNTLMKIPKKSEKNEGFVMQY